jgi:hypothetical protein
MAIKDSGSIFERVYSGMHALCSEGTLSQRLEEALTSVLPLRTDEFPVAMRDDFIAIRQGIIAVRDSGATDEDRTSLAEDYLKLYTKAARLDGTLQDVIGGLSTD